MKSTLLLAALLTAPCIVCAAPKQVTVPADMERIVATIPVNDRDFGYKHIGERLANVGMRVEAVRVDQVGKEDAEPPIYLGGDQVIVIRTSAPNDAVRAICPIIGNPEFIRRGKKVVPNNLTAAWLMNNRCQFP